MMKPYGLLLENFQENASSVNDCVFTMMHHISGDLSCPQVSRSESPAGGEWNPLLSSGETSRYREWEWNPRLGKGGVF